jgi:hypothetical protein
MLAAMQREMLAVLGRFAAALGVLALAVSFGAAQQAADPPPAALQSVPQAQPDAPPAAAPRTIPTPPEVIGAIGRFIDQSISNVGAGVKGAGDTIGAGVKGAGDTLGGATTAAGDLAKGVTDAAGTVAKLPLGNVVSGWERCVTAPNGAPDCGGASDALCKTKGFARGNSVDITTSRKCPATVWLEKRQPTEAECVNESFVSRAICQ